MVGSETKKRSINVINAPATRPQFKINSLPIMLLVRCLLLSTTNADIIGKNNARVKLIADTPKKKYSSVEAPLVNAMARPNKMAEIMRASRLRFLASEKRAITNEASKEKIVESEINAPNLNGSPIYIKSMVSTITEITKLASIPSRKISDFKPEIDAMLSLKEAVYILSFIKRKMNTKVIPYDPSALIYKKLYPR